MTVRRPFSGATRLFPAAAVAVLFGCSNAYYVADADREVQQLMAVNTEATLGDRAAWIIQPTVLPPPTTPADEPEPADPARAAGEPTAAPPVPDTPPVVYDLALALATAVRQNRGFLDRREGLYRQGLSYSLTRFQYGPQFNAAVSYLWPRNESGAESQNLGTTMSATQILPTGGSLSLSSSVDATWPFGPGSGDPNYGTGLGVTLTQPLLRGAGQEIAYEPLTQAERALVYSIRDFEDFRQGFTIQVTQQFFDLTSQKQTLANQDADYENAVFDRRKAEAMLGVGRNSEQEVFRARRREIDANDGLIDAKAAYDRAVNNFKILLGLPTTTVVELAEVEPPYEPVRFEVTSAIRAALHNRLDLITQRQQVEDAERSLRLIEDALRPNLDLVASFGTAGAANDLGHASPDEWNSSIGLSMQIPLQQKAERNAYRSGLLSLDQARRSLQLREDQLELEIENAVRELRSREEKIGLQIGQIEDQQRAVTVMQIRYESGKVDNRELFDARQALVNAKNALIRLRVDHFIARLNLLKDMGIFFVDDQGMWR